MNRRGFLQAGALAVAAAPGISMKAESTAPTLRAVKTVLMIEPSRDNPRNSEGDFITLADQTIWYVYSHFSNTSHDSGHSFLAYRYSLDGGQTFSGEYRLFPDDDISSKSVSIIRLDNNEIGLFYLVDLRPQGGDDDGVRIFPVVRFSRDEGMTWSEPLVCAHDRQYIGVNNGRAVRLSTGRIILPVTIKPRCGCYFSDDNGRTFRQSAPIPGLTGAYRALQEPGVVELADGRLMMFMRTRRRSQYFSFSGDQGETWSEPRPGNIDSPLSPASIERIPSTGDLLLVWNNNDAPWTGWWFLKRSPFNAAISRDEGRTWENIKTIYDDPRVWYCYTSIEFTSIEGEEHVLLGHTAGSGWESERLAKEWVTLFPVAALYD